MRGRCLLLLSNAPMLGASPLAFRPASGKHGRCILRELDRGHWCSLSKVVAFRKVPSKRKGQISYQCPSEETQVRPVCAHSKLTTTMRRLQRSSQRSASIQQEDVAHFRILYSTCCGIILKHMGAQSMSVQTPQHNVLHLYVTLSMP